MSHEYSNPICEHGHSCDCRAHARMAELRGEKLSIPLLPTQATDRKAVPIYSGVLRYFPRALAAIAELSRIGNEQHNPGQSLHWDRAKSTDHLDCLVRHLLEAGTEDTDKVLHDTKVAWRALANLETELEARAREVGEAPAGHKGNQQR